MCQRTTISLYELATIYVSWLTDFDNNYSKFGVKNEDFLAKTKMMRKAV
jgi:hypothetical protein